MTTQTHDSISVRQIADEYARSTMHGRAVLVDRMMRWLLTAEWLALVSVAAIVSPRVWNGTQSGLHPHLWAAILAGPCFILPFIGISLLQPGRHLSRHLLAVGQMLVSILFIDCTGGR